MRRRTRRGEEEERRQRWGVNKDDRGDGDIKWWGRALEGEYVGEKRRKRNERRGKEVRVF